MDQAREEGVKKQEESEGLNMNNDGASGKTPGSVIESFKRAWVSQEPGERQSNLKGGLEAIGHKAEKMKWIEMEEEDELCGLGAKESDGAQRNSLDGEGGRKWKKVVYGGMQPGFEDNHTDVSFLEAMVMNANVVKRDTLTAMCGSIAIAQYICVAAIVAAVWTYSLNGVLDALHLLGLDATLLVAGFAVVALTTDISLSRHALHFVYFVSGLYVLAPVFQTLTRSISSDSIWVLTVCLLSIHLFFHDYTDTSIKPRAAEARYAVRKPTTVSGNVSLNASIVASVLVASRLPSSDLVFALMLFSSEFFLLFPLVTHCIKQYSVRLHLGFSFLLILVTMALIFPLNRFALVLFVLVVVFITLVCPYWLIRIQEYKFEINGPWDEAKLCFDLD